MIGSLRIRLFLAITPLMLLLAALGGVGFVMLNRTSGRIDAILRENYASVQAMFQLNEALERIDSSFQFALAGKEEDAVRQFAANWNAFEKEFAIEDANITIHPVEDELVERLRNLKKGYHKQGQQFYLLPVGSPQRTNEYFGERGLLTQFRDIKEASSEILRINRENMEVLLGRSPGLRTNGARRLRHQPWNRGLARDRSYLVSHPHHTHTHPCRDRSGASHRPFTTTR